MKVNKIITLVLVSFVLIILNLFRMQILKGDYYYSLSERNRLRVIYLEGPRGKILDRNLEALATNRLSFNCTAIHWEAKKNISESAEILSSILEVEAKELERRFLKKKSGMFNTVIVAEDISSSQAIAIEEKLDLLPGFMIETKPRREYPYGETAAHLTGYIGPMTEEEADTFEFYGYRNVDWVGRDGAEKSYESYLRGRSGGLQMEVDNRGRFVRALGFRESKEGKDIQLTVDSKLQVYLYELLQHQKGAVVVMELGDGGVLAMSSSPAFDPNLFADSQGRKDVGKYLRNSDAPMVNRSIRGRFPAGSIFKIVTALAALEKQKITSQSEFMCPGYIMLGAKRFNCWHETGHGPQNLSKALAHSCNVFFYNAGLAAGADALFNKAVEFSFSRVTGIDLPGEKAGFIPSREWKRRIRLENWYDGETANLSIGQGYLEVTPIEALVMIGAVATKGQLIRPHVIDKIEDVKVAEKHVRSMTIPQSHWQAIQAGLDQVINSDTGSGRLARVKDLRILGKTGTAQSGQDKTHAWFVGYAPKDKPKIAMVVFLEHGGRGGVVAASLAGNVFRWLKEAQYL